MHGEGQVRLRLRGQHTRRGEAWVVDESRIVLADPLRRVRRIGDDRFEGLIVPVRRVCECVPMGDAEVGEVDVVQEHVDPAQVVGGQVDLLAEEPAAHVLLTEDLRELQQQGA